MDVYRWVYSDRRDEKHSTEDIEGSLKLSELLVLVKSVTDGLQAKSVVPLCLKISYAGNNLVTTVDDILGPEGNVASRMKQYEFRPQQSEMANTIAQAIADKQHAIVEAGTGVGKSFGYLVPAILSLQGSQGSATEDLEGKQRIVVSTHTISLQEQLMSKDIPLLNSVIPLEFSAVLAKGRGNYISLRRLQNAVRKSEQLFATEDEHYQLGQISSWSKNTPGGSRSELQWRVSSQVWDEVESDTSNCLRRKCGFYNDCHYYKARRRLQHADVIVVNHALFFVDLAMRKQGFSLLPDYNVVILDEAHTVPDVASAHLGMKVTKGQLEYSLNKLFNERNGKGLLVAQGLGDGQQLVTACRKEAEVFFGDVMTWAARNATSNYGKSITIRVRDPDIVQNSLSARIMRLSEYLGEKADGIKDASDKLSVTAASERLEAIGTELENWRCQRLQDGVYWIESSTNRYGREMVNLMASPLDIGPAMRENLFNKVDTCVMTSATIAVGSESFDFFQNRVGLTSSVSRKLGSPFDFRTQAKLIVVKNMADPNKEKDVHERQSIEAIKKYVAETDGHAFVLFTSYSFLNRAVRELTSWLTEHSLAIYSQASGVDRSQLLQQFKKNPRGVLFGTDSFWQGVDVQGDALQNVIITKLPFSVPGQPLLEARLDAIRKRGGSPFNEFQLPEAIIKFKQGFGRLIRSQTDTGMVVVLDSRIGTKPYGRAFIDSLPECDFKTVTI